MFDAVHNNTEIWMPELHEMATPTGILRRYVLFIAYGAYLLQNSSPCSHCYAKYANHMPSLLIGCLNLTSIARCYVNSCITTYK